MYCFDKCCNSGIEVIPQTVVEYNFDATWIIAKSDSTYYNNKNDYAYWIFDKNYSSNIEITDASIKAHLTGPLDSVSFFNILSEKNIGLKLNKYLK